MQSFEYVITDPAGLHARPAGQLVRQVRGYAGRVTVSANGRECEATRLMGLMGMGIRCGTAVTVTVSGEEEEAFARELKEFFGRNF